MQTLLHDSYYLWMIEGFGKWFLFLSFWFVGREILPARYLRWYALAASFATALYTVAMIVITTNQFLPPDWKYLPNRPMFPVASDTNDLLKAALKDHGQPAAAPSKPLTVQITVSPEYVEYRKWQEEFDRRRTPQRIVAISILVLTIGLTKILNHLFMRHLPTTSLTSDQREQSFRTSKSAIVGAFLFALGTSLDFLKWWYGRNVQ